MKTPFATVHEYTRLRTGMVVDIEHRPHFVERASPSCAVVRPVGRVSKEITTRDGRVVQVGFKPATFRISANSEVRIIGHARTYDAATRTFKSL